MIELKMTVYSTLLSLKISPEDHQESHSEKVQRPLEHGEGGKLASLPVKRVFSGKTRRARRVEEAASGGEN